MSGDATGRTVSSRVNLVYSFAYHLCRLSAGSSGGVNDVDIGSQSVPQFDSELVIELL